MRPAPAEGIVVNSYSLSHLPDRALLRDLLAHVSNERHVTAILLAHIAEVETRGVYRADGYSSMHAYCVGRLHFSEEAAFKRIHAARTARKHPLAFQLLADGKLHMSAILLLAGHLTDDNAGDLLTRAAHKSSTEIRSLLAERFPLPDVAFRIEAIPEQLAVGPAADGAPLAECVTASQHAPERVALCPRPLVRPLSPQRHTLRLTISQAMKNKLTHASSLLGHSAPSSNEAEVLERGLDVLIEKLEKRKYGASTEAPRRARKTRNPRYIPACVRRAVFERDRGRCTFVGTSGHRCEERKMLEFDHIEPVARGGDSTVANLRLRCRAHNRYAAEQTYGASLVRAIEQARQATAKKQAEEVIPWLQALGIRADQARQAAERSASMSGGTLEDRVKAALRFFGPRDACLRKAAPV